MNFDYIKCSYKLPRAGLSRKLFQTKSINRTGSTFFISKKGQLFMVDSLNKKRKFPFTGVVNFYDFLGGLKGWVEYRVSFNSGEINSEVEEIEYTKKEKWRESIL